MKYFILTLLAFYSFVAWAEPFAVDHTFESGQVIKAEHFNQNFTNITQEVDNIRSALLQLQSYDTSLSTQVAANDMRLDTMDIILGNVSDIASLNTDGILQLKTDSDDINARIDDLTTTVDNIDPHSTQFIDIPYTPNATYNGTYVTIDDDVYKTKELTVNLWPGGYTYVTFPLYYKVEGYTSISVSKLKTAHRPLDVLNSQKQWYRVNYHNVNNVTITGYFSPLDNQRVERYVYDHHTLSDGKYTTHGRLVGYLRFQTKDGNGVERDAMIHVDIPGSEQRSEIQRAISLVDDDNLYELTKMVNAIFIR
jgi:hypothetical protein